MILVCGDNRDRVAYIYICESGWDFISDRNLAVIRTGICIKLVITGTPEQRSRQTNIGENSINGRARMNMYISRNHKQHYNLNLAKNRKWAIMFLLLSIS